eukprot:824494-Pleurochrysis_carterae.AAC.1
MRAAGDGERDELAFGQKSVGKIWEPSRFTVGCTRSYIGASQGARWKRRQGKQTAGHAPADDVFSTQPARGSVTLAGRHDGQGLWVRLECCGSDQGIKNLIKLLLWISASVGGLGLACRGDTS